MAAGIPEPMAHGDEAIFTVSVAAELSGMHAQTLRQYDRLGLVSPSRTKGRGRRYSGEDVQALREVQRLSQGEGINLAGVALVMDLRRQLEAMRLEVARLHHALAQSATPTSRIFTADASGHVRQRPPGSAAAKISNGHLHSGVGLTPKNRTESTTVAGAKARVPSSELAGQRRAGPSKTVVSASAPQGWQRLAMLQLARTYSLGSGRTPQRTGGKVSM